MTGTSVDAVDAVLLEVTPNSIRVIDGQASPLNTSLKQRITQLFQPGHSEIDKLGEIDVELAQLYSDSVKNLLSKNQLNAVDISAIGSHGQTIRHRPQGVDYGHPFTLQIGDPNTIAAHTGIITVADFRRKDIAFGGQGAPLAPAFHEYICKQNTRPCGILNIGGIANISIIDIDATTTEKLQGFDTGPGNALMDAWVEKHQGQPYDNDGAWASTGKVNSALLTHLMSHPYLQLKPPKSTGKEQFNLTWLEQQLCAFQEIGPADVQRTLCEFTASTICNALKLTPSVSCLYVCGGGAFNSLLMRRISEQLAPIKVKSTEALGISPQWVEAAAFAWLAKQTMDGLPGNKRSVTGTSKEAILGGIYLP